MIQSCQPEKGKNMKTNYDLNKTVNTYLNKLSSYKNLSDYFYFLVSQQDEICKSSSGTLKVVFPGLYENGIIIELYGYDTLTFSRSQYVEGKTEEEVKNKVIKLFEIERSALIEEIEYEDEF